MRLVKARENGHWSFVRTRSQTLHLVRGQDSEQGDRVITACGREVRVRNLDWAYRPAAGSVELAWVCSKCRPKLLEITQPGV